MGVSLKYAVVERERRFLLKAMPAGVTESRQITDHYILGTRLRLREVRSADGTVSRKLTQKIRLSSDASEIACTNIYLDAYEWDLLRRMPARTLRKTRHLVTREGLTVAIDHLADGTLLAEIDDGACAAVATPEWLPVLADVSGDERWTGAALAAADHDAIFDRR